MPFTVTSLTGKDIDGPSFYRYGDLIFFNDEFNKMEFFCTQQQIYLVAGNPDISCCVKGVSFINPSTYLRYGLLQSIVEDYNAIGFAIMPLGTLREVGLNDILPAEGELRQVPLDLISRQELGVRAATMANKLLATKWPQDIRMIWLTQAMD